ncbi:MAG: hypothetical protein AAGF23_20870 [Acidobacteriota bacterium]
MGLNHMYSRFATSPWTLLASFFLILSPLSAPVDAQTAWTLELDSGNTELSRLDLPTALTTSVAPVGLEVINGMTGGPAGSLYVVGSVSFQDPNPTLYRLDLGDADLEAIGPLDLPNLPLVRDLATLSDGRLLMAAEVGVPAGLYEIDTATGRATPIAETERPILSLAALGDRVYASYRASNGAYGLYDLDPDTAEITLLYPLASQLFGFVNSMAAGLDGRLYLLGDYVPLVAPPTLYHVTSVVDPLTGDAEVLIDTVAQDRTGYRGLALNEVSPGIDVPGPGVAGQVMLWTLLMVAGLTLIRYRM